MKKLFLATAIIIAGCRLYAQTALSVGTDLSLLRNFTKNQGFTTFGQTVHFDVHFTEKETIYTWISYYINGKYKNNLSASAKDPLTTPQIINYTSSSKISVRQVSIGWKHFFKGRYNNDSTWNLYGSVGFGLLSGRIENTYNQPIDTAEYEVPQKSIAGSEQFKRLTFDLAAGVETQLGASIYLFGEVRSWIQASGYPSPYLYHTTIPKIIALNGGIRILFD